MISQFIQWLNGLASGAQQLVVGLILVAASGVGATIWWGIRRGSVAVVSRIQTRRQRERDETAAFASYPAELGELDHRVNAAQSLREVYELIGQSAPLFMAIIRELFVGIERFPKVSDTQADAKKRAVYVDVSQRCQKRVVSLERTAEGLASATASFIDAWRANVRVPIRTDGDKLVLTAAADVYPRIGRDTFRKLADFLKPKRAALNPLLGQQRDLTRVITRTSAALDRILSSLNTLDQFCSEELPKTIRTRLMTV